MSEQEILKGNKLIAEFIGAVYIRREDLFDDHIIEEFIYNNNHPISKQIPKVTENLYHLRYHLSWDWLMPVVEKIEEMKNENNVIYEVILGRYSMVINPHCNLQKMFHHESESKIHAAFQTIVEFIKWYNSCQKE